MATIKLEPIRIQTLRMAPVEVIGIDPMQPFLIIGRVKEGNLPRQWNARGICDHDEPYHNLNVKTPEFQDVLATARLLRPDLV